MTDKDLADLLGSAPENRPDPVFRYDVLARAAARAHAEAARARALRYAGALTLVGLVGAGVQMMGAGGPALAAAACCAAAFIVAQLAIDGPRRALERSRALFNVGL